MPVNSKTPTVYKATVMRRIGAYIIDIIFLYGIFFLLFFSLAATQEGYFFFSIVIYYLFAILYFPIFTWLYGATLGKAVLKIRVVTDQNKKPSFWRSILRELIGKIISALIMNLGYAWALWDKDKQTWHDKIASTYVVTSKPNNGKSSALEYILVLAPMILIPIIAFMAIFAIVGLAIYGNAQSSARDQKRIQDLQAIHTSLSILTSDVSTTPTLCPSQPLSCTGYSNAPDAQKTDGTGWVKADLSTTITRPTLAVDPLNNDTYFYKYCSDGVDWELNARLESTSSAQTPIQDNGDDPALYEIGTNLKLCSPLPPAS